MMTVGINEARRRFCELIRAAEGGEAIRITRRGREVAELGPLALPRGEGLPDLTAFRASLDVRGRSLTEDLAAMRDDERA